MSFVYWFCRNGAKLIFKIFYRSKVYAVATTYPKGAMIAPNHTSFFDPPIIAATWNNEVHFLASDYLFRVPLFGSLIRALNSHPVNRGAGDLTSIKIVCKLLQEGKKVVVFPEGRRSDGQMLPLKQGVAMIAARSKAAVVPAYISGTYEVWNRFKKFPKLFGRTAVVYGTPILWEEFENLDKKEAQAALTVKLTKKIKELEEWYKNGRKGNIP